jgi:hypothetical protein
MRDSEFLYSMVALFLVFLPLQWIWINSALNVKDRYPNLQNYEVDRWERILALIPTLSIGFLFGVLLVSIRSLSTEFSGWPLVGGVIGVLFWGGGLTYIMLLIRSLL